MIFVGYCDLSVMIQDLFKEETGRDLFRDALRWNR